jgi:hypothetical protein
VWIFVGFIITGAKMMTEVAIWIFAVLIGLALILAALLFLFEGAGLLLIWAMKSGFVGFAAYVACWVLLFPVMLVGSILLGFINTVFIRWRPNIT